MVAERAVAEAKTEQEVGTCRRGCSAVEAVLVGQPREGAAAATTSLLRTRRADTALARILLCRAVGKAGRWCRGYSGSSWGGGGSVPLGLGSACNGLLIPRQTSVELVMFLLRQVMEAAPGAPSPFGFECRPWRLAF